MLKFKVLTFLLTWIFIKFSEAEVPDRYFVEVNLSGSATNLMNKEASVKKKLSSFNKFVKICSSNLNASNLPSNFTDVLDKYAAKILEIQTMNDYNFVSIPVVNLSMYDYTQFRISTIMSDVKNFKAIKENLRDNSTILYDLAMKMNKQYLSNYFTMRKLKSKNKLVNSVIREILSFYSFQASYIQLLNVHIRNYEKLGKYLSTLITSKIIPTPSDLKLGSLMTGVRTVEYKLIPAQQQVITMGKVAVKKINEAQKSVAIRKVQESSDLSGIFTKMRTYFEEITSMNEYSLLGWPRLPDINADASMIKLRAKMCEDKDRNFAVSEKISLKRMKTLEILQNELNMTTARVQSSGRKVLAQSPAILNAISATTNVANMQTNYRTKLNAARIEIRSLLGGLFTTTTTTTTVPTTTTKFNQPACGNKFLNF